MSTMSTTGDKNIVYTIADLQPGKLDASYHFIGASIGERPPSTDFPPITERPLVYISLGTINNKNTEFYRQCFEAFGGLPGKFVLAAGKNTAIETLGQIPENFIVRNSVPQLKVLEKADLFITDAGMNSVHESLWNGVPMVCIPQQLEQAIVANQVAANGAGLTLAANPPFGVVSTDELRSSVDSILAERQAFQEKTQQLGDRLRSAGGAQRAADIILAE
jgi:MGT family glycosyltransferase